MERIIADRLAGSLGHPFVASCSQSLTLVLDREIDQRRCATERRGAGARFEIVRAGGAAKGHIEMSMDIDSARKNILARRVNNLPCIFPLKVLSDGGDFAGMDG